MDAGLWFLAGFHPIDGPAPTIRIVGEDSRSCLAQIHATITSESKFKLL